MANEQAKAQSENLKWSTLKNCNLKSQSKAKAPRISSLEQDVKEGDNPVVGEEGW